MISLNYFNIKICLVFVLCLAIFSVIQFNLFNELQVASEEEPMDCDAIVLWWTPFIQKSRTRVCGVTKCYVTADREFMSHPKLKALIFYGTSIKANDIPKKTSLAWGLIHEESPRNNLLLTQGDVLSLFNYSATFSRSSHFPLTFQFLHSLESITSGKYFKTFKEKNAYQTDLAPVMYLQSDCSTPNNRDSYVSELMKYIAVDSYGECLRNKQLPPESGQNVDNMMSDHILELTSRYKFTIAFENAICEDYITEKLWRPIIAGSIPLYVGSPTVKDWLPNEKSAIFPMEFESPQRLASFLNELNADEDAYNAYLSHKIHRSINDKLMSTYKSTYWWDRRGVTSVTDLFECFLCSRRKNEPLSVANTSHYNCPEPVSILSRTFNTSNWWHHMFADARNEAKNLIKTVGSF